MGMYICPVCGLSASIGKEHKCPPQPFNVLSNKGDTKNGEPLFKSETLQ